MPNAYVLMTAMPPTKGHVHLIEFAADLARQAGGSTRVIVCTQPDEPYTYERWFSLAKHFRYHEDVIVYQLYRPIEQNPEVPGFWDMWVDIMHEFGFQPGDMCVTSEPYGKTMARLLDGHFMPYDPQRELYYTKATDIREQPEKYFHDIAHTFQPFVRQTVTIFGAESTGKTTLSKELSYRMNGHWLFEWARPYLETAENVITVDSMTDIWQGQRAIQAHGARMLDKPWVIQDTDLFSTVGYWNFPHWQDTLGPVPDGLIKDAIDLKSDLYLITKSNIPFEKDPLRYKSDEGVREGSDDYWIGIAKQYNLNYIVIEPSDFDARVAEAVEFMGRHFDGIADQLEYDRQGY